MWLPPGGAHTLSKGRHFGRQAWQRNHYWHPAIGNGRRLCHTFWGQGSDEDGNAAAYRRKAQLEAALETKELALILERLASQDHAQDLDILP
jgi:hypothetical protein